MVLDLQLVMKWLKKQYNHFQIINKVNKMIYVNNN